MKGSDGIIVYWIVNELFLFICADVNQRTKKIRRKINDTFNI